MVKQATRRPNEHHCSSLLYASIVCLYLCLCICKVEQKWSSNGKATSKSPLPASMAIGWNCWQGGWVCFHNMNSDLKIVILKL